MKSNIVPNGSGERAAMGGYLPQYDEFACRVYDCILNESLEEIRVADAEENVGKLDDICYVTNNEVHAYQVKWTTADDNITYLNFKEYLIGVVRGWQSLSKLYPHRHVIPHLLTNRTLSSQDKSLINEKGERIGGFNDFCAEVIPTLNDSRDVNVKWDKTVKELQSTLKLNETDWCAFWKSFVFTAAYQQEIVDVENSANDKRTEDVLAICRLIQQMVASKDRKVLASLNGILRALHWEHRMITQYDHNLYVTLSSYEPNAKAIALLNDKLSKLHRGYIFLQGTPGSGKSTILTQWSRSVPNRSIRYYAFDFTNPSSTMNNDDHRGDATSFLFDIVKLIDAAGIKTDKRSLPSRVDFADLKNRFYEQLDAISEDYKNTGSETMIIVDGLDHITREYVSCKETLMRVLPSPSDIPEGVIFVLGSQHYNNLQLNDSIFQLFKKGEYTISMPSFVRSEVEDLSLKILKVETLPKGLLDILMQKSQGHPLYLRYMLNEIREQSLEIADNLPVYDGEIENYYRTVLQKSLNNADMKHFLGLLSRVSGSINLDFVKEWKVDAQVMMDLKNQLHHLFLWDSEIRTISFFHNSFRQYLLNVTATEVFDEQYNEAENRHYYKELAGYFHNSRVESQWNEASYLYFAGEYDAFLKIVNPEILQQHLNQFRPLWHVARDLNCAIHLVAKRRDVYTLTRYMLFKSQLDQMGMQDYSSITLTEELLVLGYTNEAKMQIREDKTLHCSQMYALRLARLFLSRNDDSEANLLFELSYPEFLSHRPNEHHNQYDSIRERLSLLEEWVYTAPLFIALSKLDRELSVFIVYMSEFAAHDNKEFDADYVTDKLRRRIIQSLIDNERWIEMEEYVDKYFGSNISMQYILYLDAIVYLLRGKESVRCNQYFEKLRAFFEQLPEGNKPCLQMSMLTHTLGKSVEVVDFYLSQVIWSKLGPMDLKGFEDKIEKLRPHLKYVELRAFCGYDDKVTDLVPSDTSDSDNALMEEFVRKLLCLAKLKGQAKVCKATGYELLSLLENYLYFFDRAKKLHQHKYSYTIVRQRKEYYEYIIDLAKDFGTETLNGVATVFDTHFDSASCNADSEEKRNAILALYHSGANVELCESMLHKLEAVMMQNQDLDGKASNAYHQGRAWLEFGEKEHAENLFHSMIVESFGVGYRKDYQPTTFAEWIGTVNKVDPSNAISRIHWLTQRLGFINDVSESCTGSRAAGQLLEDVVSLDSGMGVELAKWLLDSEYTYFEAVSCTIIHNLLQRVQCADDYKAIFGYYTQMHLYICDTYDADTNLLTTIGTRGREILGESFNRYVAELKRCVWTNCPESAHEGMIKTIDDFVGSAHKDAGTDRRLRLATQLCEAAEALRLSGKTEEAWTKAMEALKESGSSGWIRYYDGGTRLDACKVLTRIDKRKAREIAFDRIADDICDGNCYAFMNYWDEILPLLSNDIDELKMYDEKLSYMNRILRENTCNTEDVPKLSFTNQSVREVLFSWILYLAEMSVLCVADKAKMITAKMIIDDESLVQILLTKSASLILEVGMYIRELDVAKLSDFRDAAMANAIAPHYQNRIYARAILTDLKLDIPSAHKVKLPSIYSLYLPEVISPNFGNRNILDGSVDWSNASNVMAVAAHIQGYLSYVTGYKKINIDTRAMNLMAHYVDLSDWSNEADKRLGQHYQNLGLRFPYRRARAQAAIDAMMEVASELLDSGVVEGRYDDSVFMTKDFSEIRMHENLKPSFIQRIAPEQSYTTEKGWVNKCAESPRLAIPMQAYNDMFVIGEWTRIIKLTDDTPAEEFGMKVSYSTDKPKENKFFGNSHLWSPTSEYLSHGMEDPNIIVVRDGYFTWQRLQQQWIAINPAYAYTLGWEPLEDGLFAWQDANGERMVESIFWQCGNTHYRSRTNHEVSEGWLVLASPKAMDAIKSISPLYSCQLVKRGSMDDFLCSNKSYWKVHKL
jgi:hypothetical protein